MEPDFDKEIDALMRQKDFSPHDTSASEIEHLGADEISAFADNALSDASLGTYTRHLAACTPCRKILSSVIALNAESEETAEAVANPVAEARVEPWYKGFFKFPGLVYALGGLLILFAGFLAFSVVQNSSNRAASEISQISETAREPAGGPSVSDGEMFSTVQTANSSANANAMVSTNNMATANFTATSTSNAATLSNAATTRLPAEAQGKAAVKEDAFSVDGQSAGSPPPQVSAADSVVIPSPVQKDTKLEQSDRTRSPQRLENLPAAGAGIRQTREDAAKAKRSAQNAQSNAISGPRRDMNSQYNTQEQLQLMDSAANSRAVLSRRIVAGRNFELRQGVWFDSAYKGQSIVNVSRGTEAYIRLEGGLRSIADKLGGTVVLVWKDKAYRIQ